MKRGSRGGGGGGGEEQGAACGQAGSMSLPLSTYSNWEDDALSPGSPSIGHVPLPGMALLDDGTSGFPGGWEQGTPASPEVSELNDELLPLAEASDGPGSAGAGPDDGGDESASDGSWSGDAAAAESESADVEMADSDDDDGDDDSMMTDDDSADEEEGSGLYSEDAPDTESIGSRDAVVDDE